MSTSPDNNQWSQGPSQPRRGGYNPGRIAKFNEVFDNLGFASSLVFKPGVIVYYLVHGLIGGGIYVGSLFGLMAFTGAMSDITDPNSMGSTPDFGPVFLIGIFAILIYLFIWSALGAGPIAAIRNAAGGQTRAVDDIGTTFGQAFRAGLTAVPAFLLINLITVVGTFMLIIPGLIAAFFLTPAIYLVVTGQAGTIDALSQSFNLVKKHTGAVGALWVALVGGWFVLFGINLCLGFIPIIGALISLPLTLAGYAFFFVVYVSAMLTIDSAENGWTLGQPHSDIENVFE